MVAPFDDILDFTGSPDDVVKTNEPFRETTGQAAEATGVTANPTTNSSNFSVLAEMSVTLTLAGGNVFASFAGTFDLTVAPGTAVLRIMRDSSVQVGPEMRERLSATGEDHFIAFSGLDISPPIGEHTYTVEWRVTAGTLRNPGTRRQLQVQELA